MTVNDASTFGELSPTTLADALNHEQVMDIGIRPLWQPMPRLAGPAIRGMGSHNGRIPMSMTWSRSRPSTRAVGDSDRKAAPKSVTL